MFRTLVGAIISRNANRTGVTNIFRDRSGEGLDKGQDRGPEEIQQITDTIVRKRLNKIEGLRAQIRRSLATMCWLSTPVVMSFDMTEESSEALRSPITRLNGQQSILIGR
jgi:hypothetical protein